MTTQEPDAPPRDELSSPWLDLAVRLALIAGLLTWSVFIIRPFLNPMIWGSILAVTMFPLYARATHMLGDRRALTAALFVVVPLVVFAIPLVLLVESVTQDVIRLNHAYQDGELLLPPPQESARALPLIGEQLYSLWSEAYRDLSATVERLSPQLHQVRDSAIDFVRQMAGFLLTLLFSLIVMGVLLVAREQAEKTARGLSIRIAGSHGDRLVSLARDTTRSVAKGIVGVAALQAVLGGLGCVIAGVPMAGIWTLTILVFAVAQVPTLLVLGPAVFYVFQHGSLPIAICFAIWSLLVNLLDNVLKPLWMGRGVEAPMLVVFLGAIGGMLAMGILGLFVGPVVLVVTFTLGRSWARLAPQPEVVPPLTDPAANPRANPE